MKRIAISGTYSTGKTTTTEALSLLTGIPRTQARTMREILPEAVPGKTLEQCTPAELIQLGIWRFKERAVNESHCPEQFFSDGSCLHEWTYGRARMLVGINPNLGRISQRLVKLLSSPVQGAYEKIIDNFGNAVKQHAKHAYDEFIHLPVEFALVKDGHRPVSETFRNISNQILLEALDELDIRYHVVGGSIEERLEKIISIYNLPTVLTIDEAVKQASIKVNALQLTIEKDAKANQGKATVRQQIFKQLSRL